MQPAQIITTRKGKEAENPKQEPLQQEWVPCFLHALPLALLLLLRVFCDSLPRHLARFHHHCHPHLPLRSVLHLLILLPLFFSL